MDFEELLNQMRSINDCNGIYLIEPLSSESGFFTSDEQLSYVSLDTSGYPYEGIDTDYLRLQTHVRISAVENNQTFADGYYNIIIYKGSLEDGNLASFVQLCRIYAKNSNGLEFKDFFYSLISLFQLPREQGVKNAIGLYGELKFMQKVYYDYGKDMSEMWHKKGSYSQYDFSNGEESIEVKTTLSDQSEVSIKHDQIFCKHPCHLVVVSCEKYENGETIEELIESMREEPTAFRGMSFSINLARELKRVSLKDTRETRLDVRCIEFYNTETINPFPIIPDAIGQLSYRLDMSGFASLSDTQVSSLIDDF